MFCSKVLLAREIRIPHLQKIDHHLHLWLDLFQWVWDTPMLCSFFIVNWAIDFMSQKSGFIFNRFSHALNIIIVIIFIKNSILHWICQQIHLIRHQQ